MSTSNVAVDLDVRVKVQVIVKVMTDGSAFPLHLSSPYAVPLPGDHRAQARAGRSYGFP